MRATTVTYITAFSPRLDHQHTYTHINTRTPATLEHFTHSHNQSGISRWKCLISLMIFIGILFPFVQRAQQSYVIRQNDRINHQIFRFTSQPHRLDAFDWFWCTIWMFNEMELAALNWIWNCRRWNNRVAHQTHVNSTGSTNARFKSNPLRFSIETNEKEMKTKFSKNNHKQTTWLNVSTDWLTNFQRLFINLCKTQTANSGNGNNNNNKPAITTRRNGKKTKIIWFFFALFSFSNRVFVFFFFFEFCFFGFFSLVLAGCGCCILLLRFRFGRSRNALTSNGNTNAVETVPVCVVATEFA